MEFRTRFLPRRSRARTPAPARRRTGRRRYRVGTRGARCCRDALRLLSVGRASSQPSAASRGAATRAADAFRGPAGTRSGAKAGPAPSRTFEEKDGIEFASDVYQMLTHTHLSSSGAHQHFCFWPVCSPRQPTPSRFPDLVDPFRTAPHAAVTMPSKELPEGASRRPPAAASAEFPRVSMRAGTLGELEMTPEEMQVWCSEYTKTYDGQIPPMREFGVGSAPRGFSPRAAQKAAAASRAPCARRRRVGPRRDARRGDARRRARAGTRAAEPRAVPRGPPGGRRRSTTTSRR